MTSDERSTQTKVGIFIFIGIVVIGAMVVYFGRLGEGVRGSYNLRVEFPNASGIMRGSEVLLAGARVGRVATEPEILPSMEGVFVTLRIFEDVRIPIASEFTVGSSGLLGDKFVQIILKPGAKASDFIAPDSVIQGGQEGGGLGEIAQSADQLMGELRTAIGNVNSIAEKLDKGVLNEEGIASLSDTLKNLKLTSERVATASAEADQVVEQARSAVATGEQTMESAKKAADELQKTLADVRGIVRDVRRGQGALGMLIANREVAENLRALVANLRRHGILWYRDREAEAPPSR
ncbi:MAG: MlaD family protein [Terrimicrobiaceae bacterium]|nr:MlaD family protein [Terrimicrobiaceae bacterium]